MGKIVHLVWQTSSTITFPEHWHLNDMVGCSASGCQLVARWQKSSNDWKHLGPSSHWKNMVSTRRRLSRYSITSQQSNKRKPVLCRECSCKLWLNELRTRRRSCCPCAVQGVFHARCMTFQFVFFFFLQLAEGIGDQEPTSDTKFPCAFRAPSGC